MVWRLCCLCFQLRALLVAWGTHGELRVSTPHVVCHLCECTTTVTTPLMACLNRGGGRAAQDSPGHRMTLPDLDARRTELCHKCCSTLLFQKSIKTCQMESSSCSSWAPGPRPAWVRWIATESGRPSETSPA